MADDAIARSWDREYDAGRYAEDPAVEFTADVLRAAEGITDRSPGLYIGCGNGRNFLPLTASGLDLVGLDIAPRAIEQLRTRRPDLADRLRCGTLEDLPPDQHYPLIVGIQVFQHGDQPAVHAHLTAAAARVEPGGLLAIRVNATATDLAFDHTRIDDNRHGGFSITYQDGPKTGLNIHFFTDTELTTVLGPAFEPVLPLRLHSTPRADPATGQWSQWEGIWRAR